MQFDFYMPAKVLFGPGRLNELAAAKLPGRKALIVTGGTSIKKFGYLDRVIDLLKQNNCESVVFDKILPNPIKSHVMEGAAIAKSTYCDFVVGLGGGSSMDSAKSIAVMAKNPGDYWDYVSGGTGKGLPVLNGALPIICITTTAGTGTESDPWTVVTKEDTNEKIGFGNQYTFPTLSIVDPELMKTVPPDLTAYQGFDALFHSTEGFIANIANPMSDIFAEKSIDLLFRNLPAAVKDGNNIDARNFVAMANTFSGVVESTSSCTSSHSIAHAISALYPKIPHGFALIAISVPYYRLFTEKIPDRIAELGKIATFGKSDNFVTALQNLKTSCNVGGITLSQFGVKEDMAKAIAENAFDTMGGLFNLDRYKLSMNEVVDIVTCSINGDNY